MPLENKWFVAAAGASFAWALWYSDGSMAAAFGMLALTLALGWLAGRLLGRR